LVSKHEKEQAKKGITESGFDFIAEEFHERMTCYSLANNDYNQFITLYENTTIDTYYELLAYRKALNWSADG
jgi:hypothetical protein